MGLLLPACRPWGRRHGSAPCLNPASTGPVPTQWEAVPPPPWSLAPSGGNASDPRLAVPRGGGRACSSSRDPNGPNQLPGSARVWCLLRVERGGHAPAAGSRAFWCQNDVAGPHVLAQALSASPGAGSAQAQHELAQPAQGGSVPCPSPRLSARLPVRPPATMHLGLPLPAILHPSPPLLRPPGSNRSSRGQNTISFNKLNLLRLLITSGVGSDQRWRGGRSPRGPGGRGGGYIWREKPRGPLPE